MKKLALVIDNIDEEKKGKIKLRILPEMNALSEDHLPWAEPLINNRSGSSKETALIHHVPEIDSFVYCTVSEDWTSFYYIEESPSIASKYQYDESLELITTAIEDLEEQTYPQPSYSKTKDGSITFLNTETGEQGLVHPSGLFTHIRSNGTIKIKSMDTTVEILENGSIDIISSNISFLFDNENKKLILRDLENIEINGAEDFAVLFSPLKEILEKLLAHNHIAPTGPTTPAQESSGTPLSSLKSKLNDLKSVIKTD